MLAKAVAGKIGGGRPSRGLTSRDGDFSGADGGNDISSYLCANNGTSVQLKVTGFDGSRAVIEATAAGVI